MMNYFRIFARTVATATLSASFLVLSASAQTAQPQAAKPASSKTAAAQPAPASKLASETASQKSAPSTAKESAKPATKKNAAEGEAKPKAKRARHASHKAAAKPAPKKEAKPVVTTAKPAAGVPVPAAAMRPAELPELTRGRDPFAALIHASDPNAGHSNLPPGIAGLQVSTIQLQGMVKTSGGMVAVVANPQDRVYFLHDGDHIYDGVVEKIGLDEITFLQQSKDAFGRTVDRDVSKRLYPIAGDEQ